MIDESILEIVECDGINLNENYEYIFSFEAEFWNVYRSGSCLMFFVYCTEIVL